MGVPYAPKYASGHISATGDAILMFGSKVGFSGSADRMAAILDNFEWPYLRNGSLDPLSAHRAVIFAIAQLFCLK